MSSLTVITAVPQLHQQEALTCTGGFAFTGSTNGFLASGSFLLKLAVPTARAVSVTVERTETGKCMCDSN